MKLTLTVIILSIVTLGLTQTIVSSDTFSVKSFRYAEKQETIAIIDSFDSNVTIGMTDNKSIYVLTYDSVFNKKNHLRFEKPSTNFESLLGATVDEKQVSFYFRGSKLKNIGIVHFNKENHSISFEELVLDVKGEGFVNAFSYKHKFYILTVDYFSSLLNIYVFDGTGAPQKKEFDLPAAAFNEGDDWDNLSTLLNLGALKQGEAKVLYLEEKSPSSLELASAKEKMYCYDNWLVLSFDFIPNKTSFVEIDLNRFKHRLKIIDNDLFEEEEESKVKSSNYLLRDTLYQISTKKDELVVRIIDYRTETVWKEFHAYRDSPIAFKNTEFIRNGGLSAVTSEDSQVSLKQELFFKKMFKSHPGISVLDNMGNIELTIGGYEEKNYAGGGVPMMGMPMPGLALGMFAFRLSPMTGAFNQSKMSRAVFFKTLLDTAHFNHIPGELDESKIQIVKDFMKKYNVENSNEVIFLYNNSYYVAYYVMSEKRFIIVKL